METEFGAISCSERSLFMQGKRKAITAEDFSYATFE